MKPTRTPQLDSKTYIHLYHSWVYSYKGYTWNLKKIRFQKCFKKNLRKSQWHCWFNEVILLKRSDSDLVTILMLFILIQMVWCGFAQYMFIIKMVLLYVFKEECGFTQQKSHVITHNIKEKKKKNKIQI